MKAINKLITGIFLVAAIAINAKAQKKPSVQDVSVRAPENIRIDGKLDEWGDKELKAYNTASRIFYVVSNDDSNLYLTIRGLGTRVAIKALQGGITLTINHATEKKARQKATDNVVVTFPLPIDRKTTSYIIDPETRIAHYLRDTIANIKQIDSIALETTNRANNSLKEIKVTGVKGITDTILSIYNTEGIKAAMGFRRAAPVYELAIPLKYLGLSVDKPVKFSYNIKLNFPPQLDYNGNPATSSSSSPPTFDGHPDPDQMYLENTTDFWGEYILAKKP